MTEARADEVENDMTPEERIAWLRDRGVLVETADERHRKQVVNAMKLADQMEEAEISYVRIPADTSQPLQEFQFQPVPGTGGDQLLGHLKSAFLADGAGGESRRVDTELLRQQQPTLLADGTVQTSVSEASLQQVAAQANIETFSLVHPMPSNNFTGIQIYLDEVGMLKRLPLNRRASDFAARAGFHPAPQFCGDVYLGRLQHQPALKNCSLVLGSDTAPDAPWLKAATAQNLEYQLEMNRLTGRSNDTRQPAVSGSDGTAVVEQGYSWTQTEDELEVVVPLSEYVTSKDLSVKFRPQNLQVFQRQEPVVSLPLFERVDVDACTWTLDRGGSEDLPKRLVITMEKGEQALWPRIRD